MSQINARTEGLFDFIENINEIYKKTLSKHYSFPIEANNHINIDDLKDACDELNLNFEALRRGK